MPDFALTTLDISAVVLYALVIFGIGLYFSRKTADGEDYFLAGRSLSWGLIGISLLASNLSSSRSVVDAMLATRVQLSTKRALFLSQHRSRDVQQISSDLM